MKKINCPNCDIEMNEVILFSHYGVKIPIEQCDDCGGLWFDDFEYLRASHDEHKKLKKFDEKKFLEDTVLKAELFCPKDGEKLKILKDKYFSETIEVDYCSKCHGTWFVHGKFEKYQKERKEKKLKNKKEKKIDEELEKQIESMFATNSVQHKYNSIGNIGRTLSKPVRSLKIGFSEKSEIPQDPISNLAKGIYLVVSSLMIIAARIRAGK